jgi:regulator of CtrA degradation
LLEPPGGVSHRDDLGDDRGANMMNDSHSVGRGSSEPVAFGRRLAGSETFKAMFREGMGLVEETASYLDRDGRRESKRLSRTGSLSYAAESMRLTTRLMQIASWLLLQRAVNEGDISNDQACHERAKVKLGGVSSSTDGPGWEDLPDRLKELIGRSLRLQERVIRLDAALRSDAEPPAGDNPIARDLGRIAAAFSHK